MFKKVFLTPEKEKTLSILYKNPATGLGSIPSLYSQLKKQNLTYSKGNPDGITYANIKEWLHKQEPYQIMKPRTNTYESFIAEGPLQQFQVDLIYMPKSWFNNGFKYIFAAVDVFTKKAVMIPLKERDQHTSTEAFKKILKSLGVPKTIYSDQGSEFKNKPFLELLEKNGITPIFALDHAPFVEALNKNIKNRLYKYMAYHNTDNWSKILPKIIDAYNDTPHSSTGIAPNDVNASNAMQAKLNMAKRAKRKTYEPVNEGDTVRIPKINKVKKGYKPQWSYELQTVDKKLKNGLYEINGELYPRKELQKLTKEVIKPTSLTPIMEAKRINENEIGQAMNSKLVKEIVDKPTKKQVKQDLKADTIKMRKRKEEPVDNDKYYVVDKILDQKTENGKTYYLVKWKWYPKSQATWEPVENFKYPKKLGEK
jgi:transposase InsO family protein